MPPPAIWPTISRAAAVRRHHGLGLIVGAGGGGEQQRAIGDRRSTVSNSSARSRIWSAPAAARCAATFGQPSRGLTMPQPRQREIAHGARRHADVLAELRLDQNDDGAVEVEA